MQSPGCAAFWTLSCGSSPVTQHRNRPADCRDYLRIEIDRAVDGRDAHPIAIISHARDDPLHHAPRMEHAAGKRVSRRVRGRGEAKYIGVANRLGAQAGAEQIADHAADPRVRPAIGFQGRGMVVRLDFEGDIPIAVEAHDARVVLEHADAPIVQPAGQREPMIAADAAPLAAKIVSFSMLPKSRFKSGPR